MEGKSHMVMTKQQKIPSPDKVIRFVEERFVRFGEQRRYQIARLVYEIAKKEGILPSEVFEGRLFGASFDEIKRYLLQRRFPTVSYAEIKNCILPRLDILPTNAIDTSSPRGVLPKKFVIEKSVVNTSFVSMLKRRYSNQCAFEVIDSYKKERQKKAYTIQHYNERMDTFYIIRQQYTFFKPCPCSLKTVSCGYHNVNLGSGCAFECSYCCLQGYINSPGITLPANLEDFFDAFSRYKQNIRLGSGELTDSLVFDGITEFSIPIVEFFRKFSHSTFEFKTKSVRIDNLLRVKGAPNIVIAWSMNPQRMIDEHEFYTASLKERIDAAARCIEAGYKVAFHFDPIIYYPYWEEEYKDTVDRIFSVIDSKRIAWVSLGALRMSIDLKRVIENRFINNSILNGDLITGYDGKYRYPVARRVEMFSKMKSWIQAYAPDVYLYLCMEEKDVCRLTRMAPLKEFS